MVILQANEEWRHDERRRASAQKLCEEYVRMYNQLARQLVIAEGILEKIKKAGGKEELPDAFNGYRCDSFLTKIQDCKRKANHYSNPSKALIGNMAAFGEGSK